MVAVALRFIREHACEGTNVTDLLKAVPMSRSALERRFAEAVRRTPKEEFLRVQVARAKQLLSETDLKLPDIAERAGLKHAEYLSVLFKRETGMTPGEFRRQHTKPRSPA